MLGIQVVSHPLLPGMVIGAGEEGDELGDFFGRHVDVVSEGNQQSAKNLDAQNSENDYTMVDDNGDTMPVAK